VTVSCSLHAVNSLENSVSAVRHRTGRQRWAVRVTPT